MAFSRTPLISFLLISLLLPPQWLGLRLTSASRHLCLLLLPKLDRWLRLLEDYRPASPSLSSSPHRHPLLHRFLL
ncbi:hypothetical protein Pint_09778 [Pistacia integerrima]|uniref:Uncharacterized protein n=1 Tax=Pistacia integerrima TaxID=434235 RepID=A0ACC0XK99_9ROSI|nr:hypothetical protein Pint_09778 [Pistacia integerrima]